jgi:hypothetical protein
MPAIQAQAKREVQLIQAERMVMKMVRLRNLDVLIWRFWAALHEYLHANK